MPFLILTADAVAGMREQFLGEGFDDYLAKPLDGATLEWTLMRYLPKEKVLPAEESETPAEKTSAPPEPQEQKAGEQTEEPPILDKATGLQYCAGDKEFYRELSEMFADLYPKKRQQIEEAFSGGDWKNYTTYVHALKSSALSIGGKRLSEAARLLEEQGKRAIEGNAETEALDYIRAHHEEFLALYEEFANEARALGEGKEVFL